MGGLFPLPAGKGDRLSGKQDLEIKQIARTIAFLDQLVDALKGNHERLDSFAVNSATGAFSADIKGDQHF